jgi:hypothetical protein
MKTRFSARASVRGDRCAYFDGGAYEAFRLGEDEPVLGFEDLETDRERLSILGRLDGDGLFEGLDLKI